MLPHVFHDMVRLENDSSLYNSGMEGGEKKRAEQMQLFMFRGNRA